MHTVQRSYIGKIPVITIHIPDSPKAIVSVCFPFGSMSDPKGKSGLTNLASSCRIQSTEAYSSDELDEILESDCITLY